MMIFAGLDVSDKTTHICVVDGDGVVIRRDAVATDPDVLAKWLAKHCPSLVRVVLETGPLSTFLYHGLVERKLPVICICARHAKKALSAQVTVTVHLNIAVTVTVASYGDSAFIYGAVTQQH